jgi:hypothetical protein
MLALDPFDVTLTLCFTPEHLGVAPHYTSPPQKAADFAAFAQWAVQKYAPQENLPGARKTDAVLTGAKR